MSLSEAEVGVPLWAAPGEAPALRVDWWFSWIFKEQVQNIKTISKK